MNRKSEEKLAALADAIERNVVEEGGGKISMVKPVDGLSTSAIIQRIVETTAADTPGGARPDCAMGRHEHNA